MGRLARKGRNVYDSEGGYGLIEVAVALLIIVVAIFLILRLAG